MDLHRIAEIFGMTSNGYSSFDDENFEKYWDLPCYISENADTIEEIETRNTITEQVKQWLETNEAKEYLLEAYDNKMPTIDEDFIQGWVVNIYESLEWTCVNTQLDQYTH